jgi:hypothetical protein
MASVLGIAEDYEHLAKQAEERALPWKVFRASIVVASVQRRRRRTPAFGHSFGW